MSATAAEHGDPGAKTWPVDAHYGIASAGKIGMWIFLLSDALSFAGLLLAYGILRGGSHAWHDPALHEPRLGINFTAGLTFLLICSSVTMVLAHAAAVEGNRKLSISGARIRRTLRWWRIRRTRRPCTEIAITISVIASGFRPLGRYPAGSPRDRCCKAGC